MAFTSCNVFWFAFKHELTKYVGQRHNTFDAAKVIQYKYTVQLKNKKITHTCTWCNGMQQQMQTEFSSENEIPEEKFPYKKTE